MKKRYILLLLVLVVAGSLVFRTARFHSVQVRPEQVKPEAIHEGEVAARLARVLQFKTVSTQDPSAFEPAEFLNLHGYFAETYPAIHSALTREIVSDYSLLYTWKGADGSKKPVLFMGHADVVPADAKQSWQEPPFSGNISGGFIWGRGALDDKSSTVAVLEAVETLLKQGFRPDRTVYLAFGHNEEVLGSGAAATAALLKSRGVQLESVLDEGSAILAGVIQGFDRPVALIGISEKGYMSLRLSVHMEGGHSSMPPRHTAVGVLSKAIVELEKRRVPASLGGPVEQMFEYLGPEMPWGQRVVFANLWLFGPLVRQILAGDPASNALIRTTTAPTMFEGSPKENILPAVASAVVNFRILPGDTSEEILAHVQSAVRDDRVKVEVMNRSEPSAISPVPSPQFDTLQKTISQLFPETLVAPTLVIGATDSRYYASLTPNVYRFVPMTLDPPDLERIHGANERIGIKDYTRAIQFYIQYIRNTASE